MRHFLLGVALLVLASCARPQPVPERPSGALLVVGTLHTLDPENPRATAALIRDGRFTCVGTRERCEAAAGSKPTVLDLGPGSAVPGLGDAHGHVLGLGRSRLAVSCRGARSEAECAERAAARAGRLPKGQWITGRGWDQNDWPGMAFPSAETLSRAVPNHPVMLNRIDGHAAWVNQRALELAGVSARTPEPAGGKIQRRADGSPSGVLVDNAMELVRRAIPPLDARQIEDALLLAMRELAQVGLTTVHDAGVGPETLAVYRRLAEQDRLPLRVYAMIDGELPLPELEEEMRRWQREPQVGRLTVRAVKLVADGALGSRGAALLEPYSDDPGNSGLFTMAPAELRRRIGLAVRAGYQPCIHAIGDRASREVLTAFAEAGPQAKALRPRVEHLQILQPSDVPLLVRSGAVASMQPTHATSDGPWAEARLGHGSARQRGAYAWRQILDAHVPLAFGSDFPIEEPDPRAGIFSAETRQWTSSDGALSPAGGWMPEQRLTRLEALHAFTAGTAYAEFSEARRGMIREGFDADLTAFKGDVLAAPAIELPSLPIAFTMVGGRIETPAPRERPPSR